MIIIIRKRKKKRKNKRNSIIYFLVPLRVCWVDFWSFWGVLGGLLEVLEGLGRLLGGSWGVLGASWGRLGPLWVVKGHFGASKVGWAAAFGPPKEGQDEAKSDPEEIKIDDKNEVEKRCSWRSSWSRLGSILGRLGNPGKAPDTTPADISWKFTFLKNKASRGDLDRSWADLRSIWGVKMGAKEVKKWS